MVDVKICGLKTPEAMTAALDGGARFVGFVFHAPSPRHVDLETASYLASYVPADVYRVGLFVDPDDAALETTLNAVHLNMIQLHGHESPGRVAEIKAKFSLPVVKALSITDARDFDHIPGYEAAADWLMFDAQSGGSGETFNWELLQTYLNENPLKKPWFLAGGLTESNIEQAMELLEPSALDVSSGVESTRGIKDPAKISAFLAKAASL